MSRFAKNSIFFAALGILLVTAFSNCTASSFKLKSIEDQSSLSSTDSSRCLVNPKTTSPSAVTKMAEDLLDTNLPAGTRLTVLLDNQCLQAGEPRSWIAAEATQDRPLAGGNTTTAALDLSRNFTGNELSEMAESDPCVLRVDTNPQLQLLSADPSYTLQKQPYLFDIRHDQVAPVLFNSDNGINQPVRVAVLDSGFDVSHPDLNSLFVRDQSGQLLAFNAIDNNTDVLDTGFHGTHVTGLIAATANNGIGISGVMGAQVQILPIKVSTDGTSVDMAAVVAGVRWAADNGAKVINMSLGGPTDRPSLREALEYAIEKGVFIVVASGNNGLQLGAGIKFYPALYAADLRGMVTVGSYDATSKEVSSFSNTSSTYVDLLAPGSNGSTGILSTVPAHLSASGYASQISKSGNIYPIHGTSMAAPLATGVVAAMIGLARSRGYEALPEQIESMIEAGAPSRSTYNNASRSGRYLDFQKFIQTVDQNTNLRLNSNDSRQNAGGTVALQSQPQNVSLAKGQTLTLSVTASSSSALLHNYRWYRNNVLLAQHRTSTLKILNATSAHSGVYRAELIAGQNKVTSANAQVTVNDSGAPPADCP